MSNLWAMYALAFMVGSIVGFSELCSRYNWSIKSILFSNAAWIYMSINGGAALLGYYAAIDWGFNAGVAGKPEGWRVLIVSGMAMAFLRSAFASIKVGDQNVGVGLVSVVEIFMRRAQLKLDQDLTLKRWNLVGPVLSQLTYETTHGFFVSVTFTILSSLTKEDKELIQLECSKIGTLEVDPDTKMQLLAMYLTGKLGEELFSQIASDAAVKFAPEVKREREQRQLHLARLAALKNTLEG